MTKVDVGKMKEYFGQDKLIPEKIFWMGQVWVKHIATVQKFRVPVRRPGLSHQCQILMEHANDMVQAPPSSARVGEGGANNLRERKNASRSIIAICPIGCSNDHSIGVTEVGRTGLWVTHVPHCPPGTG